MGLKAAKTATLNLQQVNVSAENAIVEINYREFLDLGSLAICALAVGTCQAVLDYVIPYVNEREAFGEPISHRQAVAFMVADIAIELESMRIMTWRACALAEAGKPFHREAHLARILCQERAMGIGTDGVQLLGGHGFTKEHPVERWYRDLRCLAVMHNVISL
jgi:alkylation response protein AidB-like acyl-CoA dehydrogenase